MAISNENLNKKLRYLADIPESPYPFITLYLHVNGHEFLQQAEKNRIFVKNSFQKLETKQNIKEDREKILDFLENQVSTKAHGVAVFSCSELGIFETFQSIMPFENNFTINSIPHLKQLIYQADECENALVILTDKRYARIFSVELGGFILDETDMEHVVHRFHKQGGWAQMRYQRHIQNQANHHYKEVARAATELLDNKHYDNLILIGEHDEIKNFEEYLPKRADLKIIDINNFGERGMHANINRIIEAIIEDLHSNESKKDLKKVEEIVNKSTKVFATGWQDTIKLIEEARVEEVIIPAYKTFIGWKCNGSLYVAREQCSHKPRKTDLAEEIVRMCIQSNSKIDMIRNGAAQKLEEYEGIGAIVRY